MPSVARQLTLQAEDSGLRILYGSSESRQISALLSWRDATEIQVSSGRPPASLSCRGVIGIVEAFDTAYLLIVTSIQTVATLYGKDIYKITGVATIPLSSQYEASIALSGLKSKRAVETPLAFLAGAFDAEEAEDDVWQETEKKPVRSRRSSQVHTSRSGVNIAHEVFRATGAQGKENGLQAVKRNLRRDQDEVPLHKRSTSMGTEAHIRPSLPSRTPSDTIEREDKAINVMPRIVLCIRKLLTSGCFFLSYDLDITRKLSNQSEPSTRSQAKNVWQRADAEYLWNHHLASELIEAGHEALVVPIIQGFVGQRHVELLGAKVISSDIEDDSAESPISPSHADTARPQRLTLTLLSRRSVHRNGLRYLRRGLDKNGSVANFVETEQLLTPPTSIDGQTSELSFIQIRGSIPLYFTQSPALKAPVPMLRRGTAANSEAFAKHEEELEQRYGNVHMLSLINRHGREGAIGEAFEKTTQTYRASRQRDASQHQLSFDWFDFHELCKGMHFENVSVIIAHIEEFLSKSEWTTSSPSGLQKKQKGIIRTNCMDCLDRTNVVQAAIAQHILEAQLTEIQGQTVKLRDSTSTAWYDSLWADNGDAISTAYTSTGAMKGDFVRTRTRNWKGVLNDGLIAVSRYYYNLITDFFLQAVIDLCLGIADERAFIDLENGMAMKMIEREYEHDEGQERKVLKTLTAADGVIAGWIVDEHTAQKSGRIFLLLVEGGLDRVRYDWDADSVEVRDHASAESIKSIAWGPTVGGELTKGEFAFTINGNGAEWMFSIRPSSIAGKKASIKEDIEQIVNDVKEWLEECSQHSIDVTMEPHTIAGQQVGWMDWLSSSAQSMFLG